MTERILGNAHVVVRDEVFIGSVKLAGESIAAIDRGPTAVAGAEDLGGDYLLSGLVELHTDNLEKHAAPRPGVRWPMLAAVLAHDAQVAAAGITTVFDALAIGESRDDFLRSEILHKAVDTLRSAQAGGLLRAEHFLHMRCEIGQPGVAETFAPFAGDLLVRLVSLMDHTPGQRQFASLDKYREYYQGKFHYSDHEMEWLIRRRVAEQKIHVEANRGAIVARCAERGLPTASHDDATPDHIAEAVSLGMTIAEFPTTRAAAEAARARGMAVIMGAPNVVRGGSHSGNVSALELAEAGLLDALSSDYVPSSLLHSAFLLHQRLDVALPEAVAKVSANPARMLGLGDRGEIAVGRRADLIHVTMADDLPVVRQVWRAGRRVV